MRMLLSRHRLRTVAPLLPMLCVIIPALVVGEVSTSHCAWPLDRCDQGRTSMAKAQGPCAPNTVYSRRYGTAEYVGPDNLTLAYGIWLLAPDGHLIWELAEGIFGVAGFDDHHFYLEYYPSQYSDWHLRSFDLEGRLLWEGPSMLRYSEFSIIQGRGIAISNGTGLISFFSELGELTEKIQATSAATTGESYYFSKPAFNSDGTAVWLQGIRYFLGRSYVKYMISSELCLDPAWIDSYATEELKEDTVDAVAINEGGRVFFFTPRQVTAYEDAHLQTKLWQHEFDHGWISWDMYCCDPFGGCYVVVAKERNSEVDGFDLVRLDQNGGKAWTLRLEPTGASYTGEGPICDSAGNVYLTRRGELVSYSSEGELRWALELGYHLLYLGPMDSRGCIYCSQWWSAPNRKRFLVGDMPPQHSRVLVKRPERLNGDVYSPGDEVVILLQPYNFGEDEVVDGYLAVILPNGAISYYTDAGFSASPTPWFANIYLPNSFEIIDAPVSLGVIPEGAPEGTYTIIAGFTEPGTLTPVDELFPLTFEVVGR